MHYYCTREYACPVCDYPDGRANHYQHCHVVDEAPWAASLWYGPKTGWVRVQDLDPKTGERRLNVRPA